MSVNAGGTIATLTFTGAATAHINANDIANLTVTFANSAFTGGLLAANVAGGTGANNSGRGIDFSGLASIAYAGLITETNTNTGAVSGSITATITGDTFSAGVAGGLLTTVTNVPTGLTAVVTRTSNTVVTVTLTGSASAHGSANSISNLGIAFADGAFTTTPLSSNVTNSVYSSGMIAYIDSGTLTYASSTFTERVQNDGGISNTINMALTGSPVFSVTNGNLTGGGVHYTASNVPAGLTPVITVNSTGTNAVLSLTGTATAHAVGNNVSNITIAFTNAAFTGALATEVTNSTKNNIATTYIAPASPTLITVSSTQAGIEDDASTSCAGAACTNVTFTVSIDEPAISTVSFSYALSTGANPDATTAVDFSVPAASDSIAIGQTSKVITVPVLTDLLVE